MRRLLLAALVLTAALIGGFLIWVGWAIGWYVMLAAILAAVAGAIVVLALLRRGLPELGWLTGLVTFGIVLVVLFQVVMPWLYASGDRSWPYASRAAGRAKGIQDLRASEAIDPVAGGGEAATREYCRERERIDENALQQKQVGLLQERRGGRIIDKAKEDEMFGRVPAIAKDRLDCQQKAGAGIPRRPGPKPVTSYLPTSGQGWFVLIGSLLLVLAVVAGMSRPRIVAATPPAGSPATPILTSPGRLRRAALAAIAVLLVLTLAYWFLWGGGRAVFAKSIGADAVAAVPPSGMQLIDVPLLDPTRAVPLGGFLGRFGGTMPPWPYKVDPRDMRGPLRIEFTDGTTDTLSPGELKEFGRTRYPETFQGLGVARLWLCPRPPCW